MRWSVTTPPTGTILTWDQLKYHITPGSLTQQPLIMDYLAEATAYAESMMECKLLTQTITAIYDYKDIGVYDAYFGGKFAQHRRGMLLPTGPVQSISSVTDASGNPVTYLWHREGNADFVIPTQPITFTQEPITIVFVAGFTSVPADIAGMIRVHTATKYMFRENTTNMPANAIHKMDEFYRFRGRGWSVA